MPNVNEKEHVRRWVNSLVGGDLYQNPIIHPGFKFVQGRTPEQLALYQTKANLPATFKSTKR